MLSEIKEIKQNISTLKSFWSQRNRKFQDWYTILLMIDTLAIRGKQSYISNEPMSFYNMAHFLLTRGELSHIPPIESESALELDRRARVNRACDYMWSTIDRKRQLGGGQPYVDELGFYLLVLGWYSAVFMFDKDTGLLQSQLWNPYDVFPSYSNNTLSQCVHSYTCSVEEVIAKAAANGWNYQPPRGTITTDVTLDDYFTYDNDGLNNIILVNGNDVTGWVDRPEMEVIVAPVGGFPDRGSLSRGSGGKDWRQLIGRSIFEVNSTIGNYFNQWKSMISQVLKDAAKPVVQEFSAEAKATPEEIASGQGLFHYAPNEPGLKRLEPANVPVEIQRHLEEIRREIQKGSFNDAVYGMVAGQAGYALSLLATSSANQILYPYMDGKHFVISEGDRFWLSQLKTSKRVFDIKGKLIEKLKPTDIPEDVSVIVESDVATPKDWLERATIGNSLDKHLDIDTIVTEIYKLKDPQAIKRRKRLDQLLDHPMSIQLELASAWEAYADYLDSRGDSKQANRFRRAAQALDTQIGTPAPGQAKPEEMGRVMAQRQAGAPEEVTPVSSKVAPPEVVGISPEELRQRIGRGKVRVP